MKKLKVVFDFVKLPVILLVEFAKNVVLKMTGNSFFADPNPPLADVTTAVNDLETAITNADGGGKLQTALMHQAAATLTEMLHKLAIHVDLVANHDEAVILSSGFHTSKLPLPANKPEFRVRSGASPGEIVMVHKAIKGARAYIWQLNKNENPNGEDGWVSAGISTQARCVVSDLEQGKIVWFRCCGLTTSGLTSWSDVISRFVA